MRLIVLADWSEIKINLYKYTPITSLLENVRKQENIDGLVILGDIAYDLDSNNGSNYEKFMKILS